MTTESHELWAMAQLAPGEGIEDGAARIAERLERDRHRPVASDQPRPTPRTDKAVIEDEGRFHNLYPDGKGKPVSHLRMARIERESDAREERIRELEGLLETARIISSDSCKLLEEAGGTIKALEAENAKLREAVSIFLGRTRTGIAGKGMFVSKGELQELAQALAGEEGEEG